MKIFRIENPVTNNGMWYDGNGKYSPFILNLSEGQSKNLPMGHDDTHGKDGKRWYSAGKSKENMNQWFSAMDAYELMAAGYKLFEFDISEWQMKEHEILFTREGIVKSSVIELDVLWDMSAI